MSEKSLSRPDPSTDPAHPVAPPARTEWMSNLWQSSWWGPMESELRWRERFLFASVGAGSWTASRFDPVLVSAVETFSGLPGLLAVSIGVSAVAVWFGMLLAWRERGCSPSRLFIEGLLFPALTGSLIAAESPISLVLENIR